DNQNPCASFATWFIEEATSFQKVSLLVQCRHHFFILSILFILSRISIISLLTCTSSVKPQCSKNLLSFNFTTSTPFSSTLLPGIPIEESAEVPVTCTRENT